MNKIKNMVLVGVEKEDDLVDKLVLLRLYDEYEKYQQSKMLANGFVTLLKLKRACVNIDNNIPNYLAMNDSFDGDKVLNFIQKKRLILKNYFLNLDLNNREKVEKCIELITILECLLKQPITFSFYIEKCVENIVERDMKEGEKNANFIRNFKK